MPESLLSPAIARAVTGSRRPEGLPPGVVPIRPEMICPTELQMVELARRVADGETDNSLLHDLSWAITCVRTARDWKEGRYVQNLKTPVLPIREFDAEVMAAGVHDLSAHEQACRDPRPCGDLDLEYEPSWAAPMTAPAPVKPAWTPTHRHYKGGLYRLLFYALNTETGRNVAVYENEAGERFARPAMTFLDAAFDETGFAVRRFEPLQEPEPPALVPEPPTP